MLFKKWEKDILFKAKYSYDVDYETKRIAHLIFSRKEKLFENHLNALERKWIALEFELAKTKIHISELKTKKGRCLTYTFLFLT